MLTSVERGESLTKALQGAVSETVYEQLVNIIYDLVQTQSTKLGLDELRKLGYHPDIKLDIKSHTQEKVKETSGLEVNDIEGQRNYVIDDKMHGVSAQIYWFRSSTLGDGATSQDKITHNSEVSKPCLEMKHDQMEGNRSEEAHVVKDNVFKYDAVIQSHTVDQPHDNDQMITVTEDNDVTNNEQNKEVRQFVESAKALSVEKDNGRAMLEANQSKNVDRNGEGNENMLKNDSRDGGTMVEDLSVMCSSALLSYHHVSDFYFTSIKISNCII